MKYVIPFLLLSSLFVQCDDPAIKSSSPGMIAYVNRENGTNHIYLMELDKNYRGVNSRRLTTTVESEDYPSWSPDGALLAYQRSKDGSGIYVSKPDGTAVTRLSPIPGFDVNPTWSPDGTKILYVRVLDLITPNVMPQTEIRVMNIDGSNDRAILSANNFSVEPRWSVNNQIVFMGFRNGYMHILTMNIDGSSLQQLTTEGNNGDPAWSPDGTRISFGSDREGSGKLNIYTMNADGSSVQQITRVEVPYETGDTSWSPDGARIAFEWDIDGKKQSDPDAYAEVWTVDSDGKNASSTLQRCSGVGCAPRWRPVK